MSAQESSYPMPIDTAALRIIVYPDPRLRQACKPVDVFDESLRRLAQRMIQLMHEDKGVGLAAPQVGLSLRLFVWNLTADPDKNVACINPTLADFEGMTEAEEGCLSIPDVTVKVRRHSRCTLRALDLSGKPFEMVGDDLAARCWQHECDHLDGRLIIDRMSEADKIANRKAIKQLESKRKRGAVAL